MFTSLKEFLAANLPGGSEGDNHERSIELCAAVLMLEISLADSQLHEDELRVIEQAIQRNFHLGTDEVDTLLELARKEVDHAVSIHDFTRLIKDSLDMTEKIRLVEMLWRVANADGVIDKYEEYFIRKIADLLYVPHKDYIKAKLRAAEQGGA
jgi:uncharacterized tellurite resistance protein B-like protein